MYLHFFNYILNYIHNSYIKKTQELKILESFYSKLFLFCFVYFINKTPIIYNILKIVSLLRYIIHNARKENLPSSRKNVG